ncbi:MAG: fumarate reductase/succinate dehydrogenase flavoprotein subunit, partial [bacterium]
KKVSTDMPEFRKTEEEARERVNKLLSVGGRVPADEFHRLLGLIMWDQCGMARDEAGLKKAISEIRALRERFWKEVAVPGTGTELNQSLERAGRVADFLEFGELLCLDALSREESCGGHFRTEHQTPEGEALRHDDKFAQVFAWMFTGEGNAPELVKEPLNYEAVHLATRSYK